MNVRVRGLASGAIILFLLLLTVSCSDDGTSPEVMPEPDVYLSGVSQWEDFSPTAATFEGPVAPTDTTSVWEGDQGFVCVSTPCSITRTPEDIVTFNAGADILWPGALIQGQTFVGGIGSMEELPIRQRAPLTISIDMLFEANHLTVVNPDLASVQSAVGMLIDDAQQAGHQAGSAIFYEKTTTHSLEQAALKLGLSAKYMGFSVSSQLEMDRSVEETTVAAFFKQRMFTVSVVQPQTPGEFFTEDLTPDLLQEQVDLGRVGVDNPPVYVSQVVYGRLMMLTMTSTATREQMNAALDASYESVAGGGSLAADSEHLAVLEEAKIQVVAVGGDASGVLALLRSGNLGDYFASEAPLTTAMPIAYKLRALSDNELALVSETTSYDINDCTPSQVTLDGSQADWSNRVQSAGGTVFEFYPSRANITLASNVDNQPANNANLPQTLTFQGDAFTPALPFNFALVCRQAGGSNFTYNDTEFSSSKFPLLSVGDVDNAEDDDFEIRVFDIQPGVRVTGIAVEVGDNGSTGGEWVEVFNELGDLIQMFQTGLPRSSGYAFMGISNVDMSMGSILYNEDSGGDDICLQSIWFSYDPD